MTARKKATVQGARRVTANLDDLASLFQSHHEALGVPKKVAMDFAYRCDLLSDAIEKGFNIKSAAFFNPAEIGEEVPGPLQFDPNNPFMDGEFTQERFRMLAEKQMSGELASNAAAHKADPKLASLIAAEAAKLAFLAFKKAEEAKEKDAEDEEKPEEAKKAAKKGEDAPVDSEKDAEDVPEEAKKAASLFGLFSAK